MSKILFFDAGPVITLVMSRLGWLLPELKKTFGGRFCITPAVEFELVERPLSVKRFEFEALEVLKMINSGVLEVYGKVPQKKVLQLITLANSSFSINNNTMDIIQEGEMQSVAAALQEQAAVVMDERTLRLFIENSEAMKNFLQRRFQKDVVADDVRIRQFSRQLQGVPIIRSVELIGVAFKLGLLDSYVPQRKLGRQMLLDAVLWASKYNGCAVTEHEVEEIKSFLLKQRLHHS